MVRKPLGVLALLALLGCAGISSASPDPITIDVFNGNWYASRAILACVDGSGPDIRIYGLTFNASTTLLRRRRGCFAYLTTVFAQPGNAFTFPIASKVDDGDRLCIVIGATINLTTAWNCTEGSEN